MLQVNNEKEKEILKKFQEKVADLEQDEMTCLRFLVAREYKIDLAEAMLRNNITWRKEVGIQNHLSWEKELEDIIDEFGFEVTGLSHNGGPVVWVPVGRWNARYHIERGKQQQVTHYGLHILETALTKMKEQDNRQVVVILGIETLTYYKVSHLNTLKVLYATFQTLEQAYPEILQSLMVVNAPWVFSIAFNFIKPILSPRTLEKIQVFGEDKSKWLPALRQLMPDSSIPYLKE